MKLSWMEEEQPSAQLLLLRVSVWTFAAPAEPGDDNPKLSFTSQVKKGFTKKAVDHRRCCWHEAAGGADTYLSARRKLADKGKVGISSGLEKAQ